MTVKATVLFGSPRCEIATILNQKLESSVATQIVVGFATLNGLGAIESAIRMNPRSLQAFVVGAGTHKAFEAFDRLLGLGVQADSLRVHLGHARSDGGKVRNKFRPMLHSKIFYTEHADGSASAVIGSHNATGFALLGLNGEAAVLLEGSRESAEFEKIRAHIASAKKEATQYTYSSRPALAWWTRQYLEGLAMRANEAPTDVENKKTFVILCENKGIPPEVGQILYVELPKDLGKITSLSAGFHLYVFDQLPKSPTEGLALLASARAFACEMVGVDIERGTRELQTDWTLSDPLRPSLVATGGSLRPTPKPEMQQVRVRLKRSNTKRYDYVFDRPRADWDPVCDEGETVSFPQRYSKEIPDVSNGSVPTKKTWLLVKGLRPKDFSGESSYAIALKKMSPDEGAFVMMSLGRRTVAG